MRKISAHDEREIASYVKHNPTSLKSVVESKKKEVAGKMKTYKDSHGKEVPREQHDSYKRLAPGGKLSVMRRDSGWDEYHKPTKRSQKGKESLNIPRGEKNEGNTMQEGKNENNRA